MFDSLKKKLKESIEKLSKKGDQQPEARPAKPEPIIQPKAQKAIPKPESRAQAKAPKPAIVKPKDKPKPEKAQKTQAPAKPVESVPVFQKKTEPEPIISAPKIEGRAEAEPEAKPEKRGFLGRFREKVTTKAISSEDIDSFFADTETDMLEANVALDVVDFLKLRLKENLIKKQAGRFSAKSAVQQAFEDSLFDVVNQGTVDLESIISKAKSEGRPACLIFLGFNGSGKTTSLAKLAYYLKSKGHTPVLAAADTFRAASIEQLEVHGERLGIKVIKHQYGADSAAVVFDAVKFARTKGYDVVLADTAGRSHADKNLMDELTKVMRVNKPDLKILVVDSLTGNDAVEQAKTFEKSAGVDAIVLTKVDVNKKGGAILSVSYAIKKPILFLGVGQEYANIELFEPRAFARELLE